MRNYRTAPHDTSLRGTAVHTSEEGVVKTRHLGVRLDLVKAAKHPYSPLGPGPGTARTRGDAAGQRVCARCGAARGRGTGQAPVRDFRRGGKKGATGFRRGSGGFLAFPVRKTRERRAMRPIGKDRRSAAGAPGGGQACARTVAASRSIVSAARVVR
ncbi:hypothetical protein GCM10010261_34870 [Streptomyces pilosus]|nr:hypothetical protein GCM10010261_34870 [Streptomyces pilosus]